MVLRRFFKTGVLNQLNQLYVFKKIYLYAFTSWTQYLSCSDTFSYSPAQGSMEGLYKIANGTFLDNSSEQFVRAR